MTPYRQAQKNAVEAFVLWAREYGAYHNMTQLDAMICCNALFNDTIKAAIRPMAEAALAAARKDVQR